MFQVFFYRNDKAVWVGQQKGRSYFVSNFRHLRWISHIWCHDTISTLSWKYRSFRCRTRWMNSASLELYVREYKPINHAQYRFYALPVIWGIMKPYQCCPEIQINVSGTHLLCQLQKIHVANKPCLRHCCALLHYWDVIMGAVASQITSLTIVYSTVY